jgi:FkbM family methyltransferase
MMTKRGILSYLLKPLGIQRLGGLRLLRYYGAHPFFIIRMLRASKSQICQDVFVACQLGLWKKTSAHRYFVEFGATDGITMSNTYIFEKRFGWDGLLIEPARVWKSRLIANRSSDFDFRCVFNATGQKVEFNESENAVYSTIQNFSKIDTHAQERITGGKYIVDTVTLNDVLENHNAPKIIDYLSIDTEGSEFEILKNFVFSKYSIGVITCEHNFGVNREKIKELLEFNGFIRVHEKISQFDAYNIRFIICVIFLYLN